MVGILPRSGWKLHKKPRDSHISKACSALPGTSYTGKEHRSQRLNLISQLTQKLQVCFIFVRNLRQMTAGERSACSWRHNTLCQGPPCRRLTRSLCPTGEHGCSARHRPHVYWVKSWLPRCPHSTNLWRKSGYIRRQWILSPCHEKRMGCEDVAYQGTKMLGSLWKHRHCLSFSFPFIFWRRTHWIPHTMWYPSCRHLPMQNHLWEQFRCNHCLKVPDHPKLPTAHSSYIEEVFQRKMSILPQCKKMFKTQITYSFLSVLKK